MSDVAGNTMSCDPVLTTPRGWRRAALPDHARENAVTIRKGLRALERVSATLKGRRFVACNLRTGERHIGSALRRDQRSNVTLRGGGRPTAKEATIMIAIQL